MDLAGMDFLVLVDLKAAYCLPQLEALLVQFDLAGKCEFREPQEEEEDDDWDEDKDDDD